MSADRPLATPADGLRYGPLGLPLAFCALPLYVVMPHFYATQWGMSLTAQGSLLPCALKALAAGALYRFFVQRAKKARPCNVDPC